MNQKRTPIIAVRPRRGSDLERIQTELKNNMADKLHEWAFAASNNRETKADD